MHRIGIYAFQYPRRRVPEYVLYKLEKLREHVAQLVVVCNGGLTAAGRQTLEGHADAVHVREDGDYDAGAHRHGMIDVVGWDKLASFDEVLLLTSDFFGPIFPFAELFGKMDGMDVDFWGVTAFNGPAVDTLSGGGEIPSHVHTTFLAVRQRLFRSGDFQSYWNELPPVAPPHEAAQTHEQRFTAHFRNLGYRAGVYSHDGIPLVPNPPREIPDVLLAHRCPVLCRRPFFENGATTHWHNVELRRALDVIARSSDYPTTLIWHDVLPHAVPRDLYTNTSLLDVLPTEGAPPLPVTPPRIAVMAHVYYPDMLDEMAFHWSHIPVKHDVHITTATPEAKQLIENRLAATPHPLRERTEIRVVDNRGRDISAWLVGQRDILLDGNYDLVCRLHSKKSPQFPYALSRHFKEHLYENLLASGPYVTRLLQLFADEPCLGIVMPPAINLGSDTLGNGWYTNHLGATSLAHSLNIGVPFDDFTPLAPYGSMFWARPAAIGLLAERGFGWTDFTDNSGYREGDLPHVLERLIVYAAHEAGYYAKCILTPENAAKNYVALEFHLQKERGEARRRELVEQRCDFPKLQLMRYFDKRLPANSMSRQLATRAYHAARGLVRLARPSKNP
jgi:rhamnosyltransferase